MHLESILPAIYLDKLNTISYLAKEGVNTDCVICLDEFREGEDLLELPCKHLFHKGCVSKWLVERKKICPICKRDVVVGVDDRERGTSERTPLLMDAGTQTIISTEVTDQSFSTSAPDAGHMA